MSIQRCSENIPHVFRKIFSISLGTGVQWNDWKTTYIIPEYKTEDRVNAADYRPINITPVTSPVMEKVVKHGISDKLLTPILCLNLSIISWADRSCMTCRFEFFDLITQCQELWKIPKILHPDISKAFAEISTSILHDKQCFVWIDDHYLRLNHSWIISTNYRRQLKHVTT